MVTIKRAIEPYEKKKAEKRRREHGNTAPGRKKEENTSEKFSQGFRSLDTIAGFVGTSRNTLKKAEEIVNAAEEEGTRKIF